MTITMSTKPLTTLTAELWDFLGLGPDIDLPQLDRYTISRSVHGGTRCSAYTQSEDAGAAIDAVYEYARYAGGDVMLQSPYRSVVQPSGWQVDVQTQIVVAEVRIRVVAILDADAYAEAMKDDIPDGHCCRESLRLNGPCAECKAEYVAQSCPTYSDPAVRAAIHETLSGAAR